MAQSDRFDLARLERMERRLQALIDRVDAATMRRADRALAQFLGL